MADLKAPLRRDRNVRALERYASKVQTEALDMQREAELAGDQREQHLFWAASKAALEAFNCLRQVSVLRSNERSRPRRKPSGVLDHLGVPEPQHQ